MPHIQQIEISDFKSYRGRQIIGPFKRFTSIIGPNGAGKSNLMDAISFVLGIKARDLRGTKLKDLIYEEEPRPTTASVRLVFNHGTFEDGGDTTAFERKITLQGTSQYKIDGKNVKWAEYNKALERLNIIVKTRNFLVFQGQVQSIAHMDDRKRMDMIEIISGSGDYKEDYDRLKEASRTAEDNSICISRTRKAVDDEQKKALADQEEKRKYQRMQKQYAEVKLQKFLWQCNHIEAIRDEKKEELNNLREESDKVANDLKQAQKETKQNKRNKAKLDQKQKKERKQLQITRGKFVNLEPQAAQLRIEIGHAETKISSLKEQDKSMSSDVTKVGKQIKKLNVEIKTVEDERESFEQEIADARANDPVQHLDDDALEEFEELKQKARQKTMEQQQTLNNMRPALSNIKDRISLEKDDENSLVQQKQRLSAEISTLSSEVKKISVAATTGEADISKLDTEIEDLEGKISQAVSEYTTIAQEVVNAQQELRQANATDRVTKREAKMRDMVSRLQGAFGSGVRGRLVELCTPNQRKYEVSMAMAMGKWMDAIVVDTVKLTEECYKFIKDQRIGRARILPLDGIDPSPIRETLRELGGTTKLAIDVMKYDASIEKAVRYACGNVVICNTLNQARKLKVNAKIVTLKGAILTRSGNMTGGTSRNTVANASRWNEKKWAKVRAKLKQMQERKSELETEFAGCEGIGNRRRSGRMGPIQQDLLAKQSKLSNLKNRIKCALAHCTKKEADLKHTKELLEGVKSQLKAKRPKIQKLQAESTATETKIASLDKAIIRKERQIFRAFSKKHGIKDLRAYDRDRTARKRVEQERRRAITERVAQIESKLEYEKRRNSNLRENISKMHHQLAAEDAALKAKQRKLRRLETQVSETRSTMEEQKKLKKQTVKEIKDFEEKINKLVKQIKDFRKTAKKLQVQVDQAEHELLKQRTELHKILQDARLEEVEIPMSEHDTDTESSQLGSMSVSCTPSQDHLSQSTSKTVRKDQEVLRRVDLSQLKDRKLCQDPSQYEKKKQKFLDEVKKIQATLQEIQPNMKASAVVAQVTERLQATKKDFAQALKESKKQQKSFLDIKAKRCEKFMESFNHISKKIEEVYKDLTRSGKFPAGGRAQLSLSNELEPYLGGVKLEVSPPGKRWRDIGETSGGEQTIAALALMFSIHSYSPSPFYVMDEIDAALDNHNVGQVAKYIRRKAQDMQCLIISLKDLFFSQSDSLVGILRDRKQSCSKTLTYDLGEFDEEEEA